MKALILAGGLGTRLRGVLPDTPKPMAPVAGRPFLEYLVLQLRRFGISQVVLSTGHLSQQVVEHFGDGAALDVAIEYSHESEPRGTGGAVALARRRLRGETCVVMNGDSIVDFDLSAMVEAHQARGAAATMGLITVADVSRYGSVELDADHRVVRFAEKGGGPRPGLINGGVYVLEPDVLERIPSGLEPVSLERDVFPELVASSALLGFECRERFFRDIGIPEDYRAMCDDPEPLLRAAGRP